MGYVSRREHALVNVRRYLPQEWTKDRARCRAAGVPQDVKFQTRHEQALEMLDESGSWLPHGWVTGDDEMGRCGPFREALRTRDERYLLAVPSNTLIRDADVPPSEYSGRGRHPKVPWQRVDRWCAALPESAWTTLNVRDGEQGPLTIDATLRRVQARTPTGGTGPDEMLFITREHQSEGTFQHDDYLSNAAAHTTALLEFARVAKAEHRIEECFQRGQSEAGLGDYQVRNWLVWHHHQTLSLIAAWFLTVLYYTEETRRGKNTDPRDDGPSSPPPDRGSHRTPAPIEHQLPRHRHRPTLAPTKRTRTSRTL